MEPISKVNLERLTNGIYAFTMTLMVRNIIIPQPGTITTGSALYTYLDTTFHSFIGFVGAFLILGMFWLFHFQVFHRMKTVDFHILHVHLLSLMLVVFVPFTQSITGTQLNISISDLLFQINYLIIALLLMHTWFYVRSHQDLLDGRVTAAEAAFLTRKFAVPIGVAIMGIILVFIGFPYPDFLYFIPFVIIGIFFRHPPGDAVTPAAP